MNRIPSVIVPVSILSVSAFVAGQSAPDSASPSASLLVNTPVTIQEQDVIDGEVHALQAVSLFAVLPPEPRTFQRHDLVQIIVRETSLARSSHDLETDKEYGLDGRVPRWPNISLDDLLNLQLRAGRTTDTPAAQLEFTKEFKGEGDYQRKDDLTARLTAEVIEVQPNGNLVLEARTFIKTDEEEQTIKVTGICRADDVSPANTVLSNQIHDLVIDKVHKGELKNTAKKGIISKVLDTVFAF